MKGHSHGGIYMEDHTYGGTHTEGTYTLNKLCTLDVLKPFNYSTAYVLYY